MLSSASRRSDPVTMIPAALHDHATDQEYGIASSKAKADAKTRHPLKLFYFRGKSSQLEQSAGKNSKSDGSSSNKSEMKKKSKRTQGSNNNINESINFSSASSSGYNSHMNPSDTNGGQLPQQHFSQQFYHPQTQLYHHHVEPTQIDSLPATLNDGYVGYDGIQYQPSEHSWRRSVSLRAPMVPMMIDDEIDLIDDNIEVDETNHKSYINGLNHGHHLQQQQKQTHYSHQYHQNSPYQHHQQQFLLSDESEQCVDSEPLSYHQDASYQSHHDQLEPTMPQRQQRHSSSVGQLEVDEDEDDVDDDEAAQYSQVRRPSARIADQDNYADRISILQQKQHQQMRLASALRQRQQHQRQQFTNDHRASHSSKPIPGLDGPTLSSYNHNNHINGKQFPVAIYHQPNLNQHQQHYYVNTSSSRHQNQVHDLQRRYQPTPLSQVRAAQISQQQYSTTDGKLQQNLSFASDRKSVISRGNKQAASGRSSTGSQSGTDSGALVGQSEPSSGSASISAISHPTLNQSKSKGVNSSSSSDNKMQTSGGFSSISGNQQHRSHHNQHSNRTKSPNLTQGSRRTPGGKSHSSKGQVKADDEQPLTLGFCGKVAKLLLFVSNILFWSAGIALGAWGILSLVDDHKYNLSQLLVFEPSTRMSLFQLLSWSFITLGCATILVGFCGCSAIFKNNRWILGLYIFLILAIFALDLATGLLAIIFQERLVANVRLRLANKLRSDYGVQASFTAAIDYIQTRYECCGLEGHFDYDQSLWRLQRLGGFEATVARTCCHLRNTFDDQAHVNPRPVNESMCQSNDVRFHQSYRYRKGCLDDLERLVRHKIWTFTIGCGAVGGVILLSLLFATCFCRSIPSPSGSRKSSQDNKKQAHQTTNAQQQLQRHYHR